jgi:pimeloyl-ACP methyl ester carboxylesterase
VSPWEERDIILASGQSLRVLCAGPEDGAATLLVHGFPDSPRTFDEIIEHFIHDGRRCIAPYLPGYGSSDPPPANRYDADHLATPVLGLADALGWDRFDVLGHDWGAVACYVAGSRAPARIARAVCIAMPPIRTFLRSAGLRQAVRSRYIAWFQLAGLGEIDFRAHDLRGLDELWQRWSPTWCYTAQQRAHAADALTTSGNAQAALRYYRGALRAALLNSEQRSDAIQPVSVPTLLVYGRLDGCLGPEVMERSRPDFAGESELLPVADAGHFVHREAPELVAERTLDWWRRN